ncbi:MAG: isopentenyl-diphosphate Delta-isomerase [Eggerthellaceae bacterium]|nr:isopentenyl-diphosphate Delta-isomerase [Eggerthellaceae bacterium]
MTPDVQDLMANDAARDDELILVDALDRQVGTATKWQTHEKGLLHRAFSVVLTRDGDDGPELLLAKRALCKYHSGGLWANSCCSHPRTGEEVVEAAYRRVREELGCTAVGLRRIAAFVYRAEFDNGLCEFEYDHVLVGRFEGEFALDPCEASEVRWTGFDALSDELIAEPQKFAAWVPMVLSMAMADAR